ICSVAYSNLPSKNNLLQAAADWPAGPKFPSFTIPSLPGLVRLESYPSGEAQGIDSPGNCVPSERMRLCSVKTHLHRSRLLPARFLFSSVPAVLCKGRGTTSVEVSTETKPGKREMIASFTFHTRKSD